MTSPLLDRPIDKVNKVAKPAPTLTWPLTTTEQVPAVPLQGPVHPVKDAPLPGFSVSATEEFFVAYAAQALPQLMLGPVTTPLPVRRNRTASGIRLAAVFVADTASPSSPVEGALHVPSAQAT